jgi:hypothetical protein
MTRFGELIPHDEERCRCGYEDVKSCPCPCCWCDEEWEPDE